MLSSWYSDTCATFVWAGLAKLPLAPVTLQARHAVRSETRDGLSKIYVIQYCWHDTCTNFEYLIDDTDVGTTKHSPIYERLQLKCSLLRKAH